MLIKIKSVTVGEGGVNSLKKQMYIGGGISKMNKENQGEEDGQISRILSEHTFWMPTILTYGKNNLYVHWRFLVLDLTYASS